MDIPTRPASLTCPQCGSVTDAWEWNAEDQEWDWDDEWWHDPQWPHGSGSLSNYICSRRCYVEREQGEPVPHP